MNNKITVCPSCNNAIAKSCVDIQKLGNEFLLVCKCGETIAEKDISENAANIILWRK